MQKVGAMSGSMKKWGARLDTYLRSIFLTFYYHCLYKFTGVTEHSQNNVHSDLIKLFCSIWPSNCRNFEHVKFEHEKWGANLGASLNSEGGGDTDPRPPVETPLSTISSFNVLLSNCLYFHYFKTAHPIFTLLLPHTIHRSIMQQ